MSTTLFTQHMKPREALRSDENYHTQLSITHDAQNSLKNYWAQAWSDVLSLVPVVCPETPDCPPGLEKKRGECF